MLAFKGVMPSSQMIHRANEYQQETRPFAQSDNSAHPFSLSDYPLTRDSFPRVQKELYSSVGQQSAFWPDIVLCPK